MGLPVQRQAAHDYARREGLEIVATYEDSISGVSETREGYYRLLADAETGQFEAVIVYLLDRIGRDERISHNMIYTLREAGLEIHAVNRGKVEDGFLTSIEIALSAEERRRIVQRTTAARIAMAQEGRLPTGIKSYGFLNNNGRAMIHPEKAAIVRRIFEMSAAGSTLWAIQEALNADGIPTPQPARAGNPDPLWHRTVISKILRNTAYKGDYYWSSGGKRYLIPVPPIVSPELWQQAQKGKRGRHPSSGFPLVGHLRCGVCGRRMQGKNHGEWQSYRCQSKSLPVGSCGMGHIARRKLEPVTEQAVREALSDPERVREMLAAIDKREPRHLEELRGLEEEDARWLEAFRLQAITAAELANYRADIRARMRALAIQDEGVAYPVDEFIRAALEMPFAELLKFADIMITVGPDGVFIGMERPV